MNCRGRSLEHSLCPTQQRKVAKERLQGTAGPSRELWALQKFFPEGLWVLGNRNSDLKERREGKLQGIIVACITIFARYRASF